MDEELRDRVITGTLAVIGAGGVSFGAPPAAPGAIGLGVLALLGAIFGPEELVSVLKWILVVVVVLVIIFLLFVMTAGWFLLHLIGLA